MVMGWISRVVFLMWIFRVVVSLDIGLVCSSAVLLGFFDISISSARYSLAEVENVLSFRVMSLAVFLISRRDCSGDVGVLLLSVGSVDRVKFVARDKSGGCGEGSFFLLLMCLCFYFLPWP